MGDHISSTHKVVASVPKFTVWTPSLKDRSQTLEMGLPFYHGKHVNPIENLKQSSSQTTSLAYFRDHIFLQSL